MHQKSAPVDWGNHTCLDVRVSCPPQIPSFVTIQTGWQMVWRAIVDEIDSITMSNVVELKVATSNY